MLRIGLMSDTHGYTDPKLLEVFTDVDEIWHAGDLGTIDVCRTLQSYKPFFAVYGNIDDREIRAEFPEYLVLHREGLKILMTHIGGYPGHYSPRSKKLIEEHRPDVFICGHSHILKVMRDASYNMLTMNPGAAGVQGFHHVKTVLRFEIRDAKIQNTQVVELGRRGVI